MKLEDWSRQLRQRLSSDRLVVQTTGRAETRASDDGGDLWIVARSACVFRTLDITSVPKNRVDKAVETQVPLLSPYSSPGFWFLQQGGMALIWIWDEAERLALASQIGVDQNSFNVVPESCFASAVDDGVHLYRSAEGIVAQHWKDGVIKGDHWWPKVPSAVEWRMFLRGAGRPFQEVPDVSDISYDKPGAWAGIQLGVLTDRFVETFLVKGITTVFIFLLAFQLSGTARLLAETEVVEGEIEQARGKHQEAIVHRENAFETRLKADRLWRLKATSPIYLFDQIAAALPTSSEQLLIWQLEDGQLEFVVQDPSPDLEEYVRLLEATAALTGVSVEPLPRSGQLKVTGRVTES